MKAHLSLLSAARPVGLAAVIALIAAAGTSAASAWAAFPGVAGPIAYTKRVFNEETGTVGGLFAHGPRQRQGSWQLTNDAYDDSPSYSPDGRTIVFAGSRGPGGLYESHLYLMNADGSNVRTITSGEGHDYQPSFSPSGQQVVFNRWVGSDVSHIFTIGVDGSGLRQLTNGGPGDFDPVFAPNGKWIAFVSGRDRDASTDRSDIFSMRADGSGMRVLIDGLREETSPDIAPDGRTIAFVSDRDHRSDIYLARANGRRVRALTHGRHSCRDGTCYFEPSWAPDGRHIAFLSSGCCHFTKLEAMRPDGSQRKGFAWGGTDEEFQGSVIGAPAWGARPR